MAMVSKIFAHWPENAMGGNLSADTPADVLSDSIRLTLHTSTWTPAQTTNELKADATNELTTANGYTALGIATSSKTFATSTLRTIFQAANISWTLTGAITFRYGVLWDDTMTAPVDPLIAYYDTGGDQTLNGVTFAFQWDAVNGLWYFDVA